MKKIRMVYGLLSLLTLIIGIVIYLLFRNLNNIILFKLIPKPEFIGKTLIPLKPSVFSDIFRYNLPDMLWFISAILFLRFIWFYNIKMQTVYILCFYGVGLVIETSQLSKKIPGTFDWLDLFVLFIGAFLESLLYRKFIIRRYV